MFGLCGQRHQSPPVLPMHTILSRPLNQGLPKPARPTSRQCRRKTTLDGEPGCDGSWRRLTPARRRPPASRRRAVGEHRPGSPTCRSVTCWHRMNSGLDTYPSVSLLETHRQSFSTFGNSPVIQHVQGRLNTCSRGKPVRYFDGCKRVVSCRVRVRFPGTFRP